MNSQTFFRYGTALAAGHMRPKQRLWTEPEGVRGGEPGVSVVIPSRNGKELLRAQLPGIARDLDPLAGEILVVDNGSDDGTAAWLAGAWPSVQVEVSPQPLSFACAVNRGVVRAGYSHICLLNNDMLLEPGFFAALGGAFDLVPDLFCATAQIRFPEGARREETGKAVMARETPADFPLRCDLPLPGEDLTWVLYGSGGCSVYDALKLRALGGVDEIYGPAYVEDLDLGYRAWQKGWPSVYVAGALVEHRHRATTSRYYSEAQLDAILEVNYLKFLSRAVASPKLFRRLWKEAMERLKTRAEHSAAAREALAAAARIAVAGGPREVTVQPEEDFLALTNGSVAVFPGHAPTGQPRTLVAAWSVSGPKGRRAAANFDQVLVAFTERWEPPPPEILAVCTEVVLVRRPASLGRRSAAFGAALRLSMRKWRPSEVRLESKIMQEYTPDCAPAKVIWSR
jgi:GT2 family glycosyltransferase